MALSGILMSPIFNVMRFLRRCGLWSQYRALAPWLQMAVTFKSCHIAQLTDAEPCMSKTRTIAILAVPGVQLLDVSGPLDVFAEANAQSGREYYRLQIWALEAGPVRSSSGARLLPDHVAGDGLLEV